MIDPVPADSIPQQHEPELEAATLDNLNISLSFINSIHSATLDNGGLDDETIEELCNPLEGPPNVDNPDLILCYEPYQRSCSLWKESAEVW